MTQREDGMRGDSGFDESRGKQIIGNKEKESKKNQKEKSNKRKTCRKRERGKKGN